MGFTIDTMAELWALKNGLTLAHQHGISNLVIELDTKMLVLLINNHAY
jgi:hypothetical protein